MFDFRDFTQSEKKKIEQKNKDIKDATERAKQTLHECITSDSFKKYREELEKSDKALIEIGIGILRDVQDNDKRLKLYDALFTRAEVLGLLLKGINKDNR